MFGNNQKLGPEKGDGSQLYIHKIFPTIQGEGPRAGEPAVFVRLSGCNLACSFCDTEFEQFNQMVIGEVASEVESLNQGHNIRLVVITGGEPLRQNIGPLISLLQEAGYICQIESNGTLYRALPEGAEIVCSPKVVAGKYTKPEPRLLERIIAFKFLISASNEDYQTVPVIDTKTYKIPVYVQAMDEYKLSLNKANNELAVRLAMTKGYKLSCQIHKYLAIE